MLSNQSFRALHVAIGDRAHNLDGVTGRQVDLHDGTGFRDMHMRRRMVEGVDPDLESFLANQRGQRSTEYLRP